MTDRALKQAHSQAQDLLDFIDASPSPWHAVDTAVQRLSKQGYSALDESQAWQLKAGQGYYVVRGGASIIAFHLGQKKPNETGFRLVGAHTDSPGLRLKPKTAYASDDLIRIGVEVYGGPILATFTDRDLSVAGRISVRSKNGFDLRLVKLDQPMLRLPNLAIHMNREVNDKGLLLNKQTELPLIFGQCEAGVDAEQAFLSQLAQSVKANATDILSFELNVFDTQKGSFWGANLAFIANSQLDNLASCHAALNALLATEKPMATTVCALFDHEEVGSESATGASGSFLSDVLQRISSSQQLDDDARLQAMARSFLVSADMAHAYHPNHPSAYEPCHHVLVNHGPVIKTNANHRYASNAESSARFMQLCEAAGVPYQQYAHRSDLGCGSTIGPIVAANLGVPSVDVGSPMWAMHSLRESAGVLDHAYMIAVLSALYRS
ncbi:LAP4 Aspartyl aminopeptidase [Methylophilaceae bacterium]